MLLIIFYLVVLGAFRAYRRLRARRPRGMCAGCAFVHMQHGVTGRKAVFCTFGGVVRPVQIEVLYCTDYRDRNAPARLVRIGFATESPLEKRESGRENAVGET
jgi:hypothetical protein